LRAKFLSVNSSNEKDLHNKSGPFVVKAITADCLYAVTDIEKVPPHVKLNITMIGTLKRINSIAFLD
jgi:hypothetical protein